MTNTVSDKHSTEGGLVIGAEDEMKPLPSQLHVDLQPTVGQRHPLNYVSQKNITLPAQF